MVRHQLYPRLCHIVRCHRFQTRLPNIAGGFIYTGRNCQPECQDGRSAQLFYDPVQLLLADGFGFDVACDPEKPGRG